MRPRGSRRGMALVVVVELAVAVCCLLVAAGIMLLVVSRWTSRTDHTSLGSDVGGRTSLWPVAWFFGIAGAALLAANAVQ